MTFRASRPSVSHFPLLPQESDEEKPRSSSSTTTDISMSISLKSENEAGAKAVAVVSEAVSVNPRIKELDDFLCTWEIGPLNKKKRRLLLEGTEHNLGVFKLDQIICKGCRHFNLASAFEAYEEAKRNDIAPTRSSFSNLLSLACGLGDPGSGSNQLRPKVPPQDVNVAMTVFQDMNKAKYPFSESDYTAMIRCYCMNSKEEDALQLYEQMKRCNKQPKLRTFTPLLYYFGALKRVDVCTTLFHDITQVYKMIPAERDYVSLLTLMSSVRDKRKFYLYLDQMMEDILVPTEATWNVVTHFFQDIESDFTVGVSAIDSEGVLQINSEKLRSIDLDSQTQNSLLSQIDSIASEVDTVIKTASALQISSGDIVMGGGKGKYKGYNARQNDNNAKEENTQKSLEKQEKRRTDVKTKWNAFKKYIATEVMSKDVSERYNVLIDGANCGYYKQNYSHAPSHVDYAQIDWMARQLQSMGYKPLIFLHTRHLAPNMLPREQQPIVQAWKDEGILYVTPSKCNDDWFWLYLAVLLQSKVVTNDELRDHHFLLLQPRWFERWKERHCIRFSFGPWEEKPMNKAGGVKTTWRKAIISVPPIYSRRSQCVRPGCYAFPKNDSPLWLCAYRNSDKEEERVDMKRKREEDEGNNSNS